MFNWDVVQYRADGKVLLLYRHERIFEEGLVKPGMNCADIGGWGHLSERIRQEGASCIVLDKFTEDQYYADRVKKESHKRFDLCSADWDSYVEAFDLITCFEILEHIEGQGWAINNMYKMLKPGGYLAGTFPVSGGTHPADDPHVTFISQEGIKHLMSCTGFIDIITELTPSVNKYDSHCPSFYFKGRKL